MFSRKTQPTPKSRDRGDLSQYGLFNVSNDIDAGGDDDGDSGNDSDLEAELAAITAGAGAKRKPKPKPKLIPEVNLAQMVADSLRDIESDEEGSGDDDDPDLLNELSEITGSVPDAPMPEDEAESSTSVTRDNLTVVKARLEMYKTALSNAKLAGDTSKERRSTRGLKTLESMLKKLESGHSIDVSEIPAEVSIKAAPPKTETVEVDPPPPVPARRAPSIPVPVASIAEPEMEEEPQIENPTVTMLKTRQQEYKEAALTAKKSGDKITALKLIKVVKQFDDVIKAVERGDTVDLSNMPPPASEFKDEAKPPDAAVADAPVQPVSENKEENEVQHSTVGEETLVTASTIEEALQQRLEKYKSAEQAAKEEGNSSKARRLGRIVKQYDDAIKMHSKGKTIPFDELPCPPGFAPFPGMEPPTTINNAAAGPAPLPPQPTVSPAVPSRPPLKHQDSRVSGNHLNTHVMNVQITDLQKRQREFKLAALNAKKSGDLDQAREFLKISKQFDTLIDTAEGGLPVDMTSLPIPPSQRSNLEDSFTFINDMDCNTEGDGDMAKRLEEQLQKQLGMCKTTRDHLRAMGDVTGTNRFENLALSVQKDVDLLRLSYKKNMPIPKFHYEMKNFSVVKCNTDLTDNQIDILISRGINYNVPNPTDIDTYVKLEFPFPPEEPYKNKTNVIKNEDNPEYNQNFLIDIQPKQRQCQRVFKRGTLKLEVYSRGGFLRSDPLIGTVLIKLQPLETAVEIHDSFDLMDGRKKVGGKLEVKIRLRNPILAKQIEQINEKWLVIDH